MSGNDFMDATQVDQLLAALNRIALALESKPHAAAKPAANYAPQSGGGAGKDEVIPQPGTLVDDPGAVTVPFGKNKGVRLDELAQHSLRWYAGEGWQLRPKNDGTNWPGDVQLKDAARQLWHARYGGTGTAHASKRPEPTELELANQIPGDVKADVPF